MLSSNHGSECSRAGIKVDDAFLCKNGFLVAQKIAIVSVSDSKDSRTALFWEETLHRRRFLLCWMRFCVKLQLSRLHLRLCEAVLRIGHVVEVQTLCIVTVNSTQKETTVLGGSKTGMDHTSSQSRAVHLQNACQCLLGRFVGDIPTCSVHRIDYAQ